MQFLSGTKAPLALLLAVALAARLAAGAWWQTRMPQGFAFGDSETYWRLGETIARGEPYVFRTAEGHAMRIFRTPGYPLLLAAMFRVVGDDPSLAWGRALSAVLGTLTVAGVYGLGRMLFDVRAGLVAGWIAAVYPGAVAMSIFILSEAPFCPLMLAQLILWTAAWKTPHPKRATWLSLAAGLAAGAATLMRPSWLLFTPLAVIAGLIFAGQRPRQALLAAGLAAGLVLTMAPWWIRNATLTGHFVPTTLQVGASLYDGLSRHATGASNMNFASEFVISQGKLPPLSKAGTDIDFEYGLDREMREASLVWAKANPRRVAELAGIKFLRMWNIWPNEPMFSRWPVRLAVMVGYVPVMALGLAGAWKFSRRGLPYALCWLPAVYFTLLHMVFVSSLRYREPAMLGWIVLAAGALAWSKEERV
ncbi:MAG: ArnT family glycosyltransferase [Pirellulales bacterium]